MKNGVVIVGAGHAGVQAAASLREEGYDGPVILLGDEKELPYHKPPLSKTFIKDAAAQPQPLRGETFYTGHSIDFRPGSLVERIDVAARRLALAGGDNLAYDHLILATGSRPRVLPLPGADLAGVLSLRSVADARAIRDHSAASEDVVVIGGGFIGLEIAATLAAGGRRVTVVEALDRLLGARGGAADRRACAQAPGGVGHPHPAQDDHRACRGRQRPRRGSAHLFGRKAAGEDGHHRHRRRAQCRAGASRGPRHRQRHPRRPADAQFGAKHPRHRRQCQLPPLADRLRRAAGIGAERHRPGQARRPHGSWP